MATDWLQQLQQRRVFRALVGYGVVSFGVLQIVEPIMHGLSLPEWVLTATVVALGLGFPITLVLAWVFDVNAGRLETTGPRPSPRILLLLAALGLALGAPGVGWYLWRQHRAPTGEAALRASLDAALPASEIPALPSIAVLPFVDLSPAKDQEYFSDGIAEEILNALAQLEGLHVAGRTSSFSFKGKNEDLRGVGQKLGVGVVLEGSVRKAGSRVRITAQAIKVADGFHIWSQTYDRELADIFAVQDEIARAVALVIQVKLLPGRSAVPEARRTRSQEAYTEFLLGRQCYGRHSTEDYRRALAAFERAVALDPSFAPAHAWLGSAAAWLVNSPDQAGLDRQANQRRATAEYEKAIALAPELPEARTFRAVSRMIDRDWAGARSDLELALALAPADATAHVWMSQLLAALGRLPEATAAARKAASLDPLNPLGWDYLGRYLTASGDLAEARAAFARAIQVTPEGVWAPRELGFNLLLARQPAAALALFEKQAGWVRLLGTALAQHDLGQQQAARAALDGLLALEEPPMYQVAQVYAWWGDRDRAFEWLERGVVGDDAGLRYLKYDPLMRGLRQDPRWRALLGKLKLPLE